MIEATQSAVTSTEMILQYPNLLLALAAIGAFAIIEHMFMAGKFFGGRTKKTTK